MIKKYIAALLTFFIVASIAPIHSYAADPDRIEKFIASISTDVLEVLNAKTVPEEKKEKQLNAIFQRVVDTEWIGRFVTGVHWRSASSEQKKEYLEYYGEFLRQNYVSKFRSYTNQKLVVKKIRTGFKKSNHF